jgi:small-conductance mechanosensitive channel/CRP-like cAMP-binding protein
MGVLLGILDELREDKTAELVLAALVLFALIRWLAPAHRERLRGAVVLIGLYLLLVPIAGGFRLGGMSLFRETRLAALVLVTLGFVRLSATLLFAAFLPRVKVEITKIVQDVFVAGSSLVAILLLASRAGLNLSGIIATSAVLTAVIGLAFQDTLGNVVGGLALELDDSVNVGDWIKVGDVVGKVTEVRWRYTAIETRNWETVIVPNSLLVKGQVTILGKRQGQPRYWRRWVYFNVDFRYKPSDVIATVNSAVRGISIENVAEMPQPECIVMDLTESFGRYALRYWLTNIAIDDPTDSIIRTRIYYALSRAGIPLSIPAHAIFLTEESSERKQEKTRADSERRLEALRHIGIFAVLSEDDQRLLAEHLHRAPFAPNEIMTRQGAEAHYLYVIVQGEASVRIANPQGVVREVARLGAGDFFGEMSLLTGERRSATVVSLTTVDCYRLDKSAFQELVAKRPEVTERIAALLAKRQSELGAIREDLADVSEKDMRLSQSDLLSKIRNFFGLQDDSK